MAGAFSITDFSKTSVVYPAMNGTSYVSEVRTVYMNTTPPASGLAAYTGSPALAALPFPHKYGAHVYIFGTDNASVKHRRKVMCDPDLFDGGIPDIHAISIDGITGWKYGGYVGERDRRPGS
jgi:hypothetical protein